MKKAISAATSAALLASLLATAVAPSAFALNTSTGGGTIFPGQAASTAGSITFAEDSSTTAAPNNWDQYSNGTFTVQLFDFDGASTISFDATAAPTITRVAGVGSATAAFSTTVIANDTLTVSVAGTDTTKLDSFTIGNLKVKATAAAQFGAIRLRVITDTVGLSEILTTASGLTDGGFTGSGVSQVVAIAQDPGSPDFAVTNTTATPDACVPAAVGVVGKASVAASGVSPLETVTVTAVTGSPVTALTGIFTQSKPDGVIVTQQVCASEFPSFVTVGDAISVVATPARAIADGTGFDPFQAGVNSLDGIDVFTKIGFFDGLLLSGSTITWTIQTDGVLFSPDFCAELTDNGCIEDFGTSALLTGAVFTLSADRKSISVKTTADSLANNEIVFDPNYDIALTVPNGTAVKVAVTSTPVVAVVGSPATVGTVGFVTAGSTSAPTIFIGQNDQSTGMIVLTEKAAGSIVDNGTIQVCLQSGETWAVGRNPWAVVTAGDLKLNVAGLAASQGLMTVNSTADCLTIFVFTSSTVASTIEIRDGTPTAPSASGAANGPKVNVPNSAVPGQTFVDVFVDGAQISDNIVIAVRAYSGTPTATTSGQLPVLRGLLNQASGSITFTEGSPNQFGPAFHVGFCLLIPSVPNNHAYLWSNLVGANAPVVTTNSTVSGLIASFSPTSDDQCLNVDVTDTGLSGLGSITVSNLKLDVKSDATLGPIFVRIYTSNSTICDPEQTGCVPITVSGLLQATVSPATVILQNKLSIGANSALGLRPTTGYTTKTPKVQVLRKYVTWKFTGGTALAGQRVNVLVARKVGGVWTGPKYFVSRVADANGIVTFFWKSNSALAINVRVQWPGDASHSVSTSKALGAYWK